jgi:hypothetical protein
MTLTLRTDKGSALTYQELDDNFRYVANNSTLSNVLNLGNTANNNIILNGDIIVSNVYSYSVNTSLITANSVTANSVNTQSISAPGGIILQTVYKRVDTKLAVSFATAGSTGSIITDLNTTITPKFNNSKILVNFSLSYEVVHDTIFRLFRTTSSGGTVEIGRNTTDANYWSGIWLPGYDADNSTTPRTNTFMYIDTPSTVEPVTYQLMIQSAGTAASTFFLNRSISSTGAASNEVAISQIILQELSA